MRERRNRVLLFLLVFLFICSSLGAVDILKSSIESKSYDALKVLAKAYGLDSNQDEETLKQNIYLYLATSYYGNVENLLETTIAEDSVDNESVDKGDKVDAKGSSKSFSLSISNADSFSYEDDLAIFEGNVVLSFDGKNLSANKIVIDLEQQLFTAMGSVVFSATDSQSFLGDIISYDYKSQDIVLSGGLSSTSRKNNEGKAVEFFASGDTINYSGNSDVVLFEKGVIATSNTDPYWSIKSDKIALLDGGDLFINRATLSLGRIPIFWFPVFFYPSTKLVFNPAMGLSSDKGAFINTTYSLYGAIDENSSKKESSFSSLLSSSQAGEMVKDGLIYRARTDADVIKPIEQWAEKTKSYMTLMLDVYQNEGVFLGLKTQNSLFQNKLKLGSYLALAKDFGDKEKGFRYFEQTSGSFNYNDLSFEFSLPYYSDPNVMKVYSNRLNTFSLDSLLGSEIVFPTTYNSITSFDWKLGLKYDLSSKTSLVKTLRVSPFDLQVHFVYDSREERFEAQTYSLPSLKVTVGGDLLSIDFNKSKAQKPDTVLIEKDDNTVRIENTENVGVVEAENEETVKAADLRLYSAPALLKTSDKKSSLNLTYLINQTFKNESNQDKDKDLYYKADGSLELSSSISKYFTLKNKVVPSYEYSQKKSTIKDNGRVLNNLSVSLPFIGLSYNLDFRAVNYDNKKLESFVFDKKTVSSHKISFDYTYSYFNISLSQTLKPVKQTLTPKLTFKYSGLTLTLSQKFNEFKPNLLNMSAKYKGTRFNASLTFDYQNEKKTSTIKESFDFSFFDKGPKVEHSSTVEDFKFKKMSFALAYQDSKMTLNLSDNHLILDTLNVKLTLKSKRFSWWKGRINTDLTLNLLFNYDFNNRYASNLSTSVDLKFNIAEFMDIKLTAGSSNNAFYRYYDGSKFVFGKMVEDLLRSIDFFGDGRYHTSFTLNSLDFELIHYMKDWDVHCKLASSVVLSQGSWKFNQIVTFYIQWKAIPDLKVEKVKESVL